MKKIGWRAWGLFAIAFIFTLLVYVPASLLGRIVEAGSNGQLVLANATGTLWKGSAMPALRQRTGGVAAFEKLHWEINILSLFSGKIVTQLSWENVQHDMPMVATISLDQAELRHAIIPLQAVLLGELTPLLQPAKLSGQIQIKSDHFSYSKAGLNGSASAEWTNAGSVLSAVNPLGSYRIELKGVGEKLDLTLMTTSGVLILEGQGNVTLNQGLQLKITARAAAESKGSIDELLNNLGPQSTPGVHVLNLMR